jgi:hypothetical protein
MNTGIGKPAIWKTWFADTTIYYRSGSNLSFTTNGEQKEKKTPLVFVIGLSSSMLLVLPVYGKKQI